MDRQRAALEVIAEVSRRPLTEIGPAQDLAGDLEIDSAEALRLLVTLEERLEIEIPDEAAALMEKVQDILDFVAA